MIVFARTMSPAVKRGINSERPEVAQLARADGHLTVEMEVRVLPSGPRTGVHPSGAGLATRR